MRGGVKEEEGEIDAHARGSSSPSLCPCLSRRSSCSLSPVASSWPSRPGSRRRRCGSRGGGGSTTRSSCGSRSMRISELRRCCLAGAPVQNKSRLSSEFLIEGYVGNEREGRWKTRGRERGDGDGIHVPSLDVISLNSHPFGPFWLAGSVTLP